MRPSPRQHPWRPSPGLLTATACATALLVATNSARAQSPEVVQKPSTQPSPPTQTIEIIGASPLPGQGVDRAVLPYNTQVILRSRIDTSQPDNLSDLLQRSLPGVQVNDIQGSPFQGDLTFRGYRASSLLGAAQGMSVYLDGVRMNEPFGDVVSWDLIPEFALESVSLVPGANPAFGLNTLGGSIALRTANGLSAPGWRASLSAGSFARRKAELSHGGRSGVDGSVSHFVGLGAFDERGWRDESPGRLATGLAKVSVETDSGRWGISLLLGGSRLTGNGLVPLDTFDDEGARTPDLGRLQPQAVYTHPDLTRNRLRQVSMTWERNWSDGRLLEALAYSRSAQRRTVNGDEAEEPTPEANATFNNTFTRQRGAGLAVAMSGRTAAHRWQVGLNADQARVHFEQTEQEGNFSATRGVVALAGEDPELSVAVSGQSRTLGLYGSTTSQLTPGTHLTGTLRWNQAVVSNSLTRVDDDTDERVTRPREQFRYRSLNPALGLAHRLGKTANAPTVFANIARNTRVPTVIELGCADPDEPCRLPVGLQADPYLKQVRSVSVETGLRWGLLNGSGGALTLYRADNRDDILFRSVSVTGQRGYFVNMERTRHKGLDAEWRWVGQTLNLSASYSHLRATYEADGLLRVGERNVEIRPGTSMAGLPRHVAKLSADWRLNNAWSVGADAQLMSRRKTAGNEDGRFDNEEEETADFSLPGYGVMNLRASWRPTGARGLEVGLKINNALNRRYQSYGALAQTLFTPKGAYAGDERDALFAAPGAPRSLNVSVRWMF